jgi:hypothetical protein
MKKTIINEGILLDSKDITKAVFFNEEENSYILDNVSPKMVDYYQNKYNKLKEEQKERIKDDYIYFGEYLGIEATPAGDFIDYDSNFLSVIVFNNGKFLSLNDCVVSQFYTYWAGEKHKTIYIGYREDIDIDMSDSVNLDKWDGHNFNSGEIGYHEYIYKLKNSEKYILLKNNNFKDFPEGEIMSYEDVITHLNTRKIESSHSINFIDEIFQIENL